MASMTLCSRWTGGDVSTLNIVASRKFQGYCVAWFEQGAKWEWIFIFSFLLKFFQFFSKQFHWNDILFDHPTIRNSASPYWIMEKYSKRRNRCKSLTFLAYNLQNFSNFMPRLRVSRKNIKNGETSVQETVAYVEYPEPFVAFDANPLVC